MDHEGCKQLYNEQRRKYVELKKNFIALKSSYLKLKENHDVCVKELENLKKEIENSKQFKGDRRKSNRVREVLQDSIYDEQLSHFLLKYPNKVQGSGKVDQVNPDQSIYMEGNDPLMYQGFFIIGPKASSVGVTDPLVPEILSEFYPSNTTIGHNIKSIIPTLCFPSSIFIDKYSKPTPPTNSQIKTFVITVKNENLSTRITQLPNSDHELFYIACAEFDELIYNNSNSWVVPKCYCISSFIPAFDLHFSVLKQLVSLKTQNKKPLKYHSISDEEELLLNLFKECEELSPNKLIQFGVESCGLIRYCCPKNLADIDGPWTILQLIRNLISDDFLWIIFAISQEKSIVFVSTNPSLVSGCVLALHCLLRPLKWPNLMIPLVPDSLSELLEAPIPILAGVPYITPAKRQELNTIIWVMLDEKNISKRIIKFTNNENEVVLPCWPNGIRQLKSLYPTLNDRCADGSTEDKQNCLEIKKILSEFWTCILNAHNTGQALEYGEDFMEAVCNTQMFSVTIEDIS